MLTKASLAVVAALVIASTSNGFAAQKNRFDFDFPNSTFPTPCHEGPRAAHAVLLSTLLFATVVAASTARHVR
jgi:hypothetical protein